MTTFRNRSPGLPSYVAESGTGTTISPPFYCGNPLIYHAWMISIWVYLVTVPLPYNTVIIITDNNPGNKLLWTVESLIWWRKSQFVLSPLTKPRKKKKRKKQKRAWAVPIDTYHPQWTVRRGIAINHVIHPMEIHFLANKELSGSERRRDELGPYIN